MFFLLTKAVWKAKGCNANDLRRGRRRAGRV